MAKLPSYYQWRPEVLRAGDVNVYPELQADRTAARIRQRRDEYDERMLTPLVVARLTDGRHKGKLHVCDGGTTVRRWTDADMRDRDPSHLLVAMVADMTEAEAAGLYLAVNKFGKSPTAPDNYRVGLHAGFDEPVAIERALRPLNLEVASNANYGTPEHRGTVAAIASMAAIVKDAHRRYGDWLIASDALKWTLSVCRMAYKDESAHDGDLIRAVAHLSMANPDLATDVQAVDRLVSTLATENVAIWRSRAMAGEMADGYAYGKASTGGSASRGRRIAHLVADRYNKGQRTNRRLTAELPSVRTRRARGTVDTATRSA